jgi:predicted AAA+ superfamily ATPase
MEKLFEFQETLLQAVDNTFRRFLHTQINWNQRMIAIKGPRGAGKTTLLLQHFKFDCGMAEEVLYISLDHHWFYNHSLYETALDWYKMGGKTLLIDEVHKYPRWSVELKNIYDGIPQMTVVFTASSALDIYRGDADLSRRVITYNLPGLSFREYLKFTGQLDFYPVTLDEILNNHLSLTRNIVEDFRPLAAFRKYLEFGYLPIISEGEDTYPIKLARIINTVVENDLAYIESYNTGTAIKVKNLLGVIAESVPFKPNIAALSRKLDLSRDRVYQYIYQLRNAGLLNTISVPGKGISTLQKPEKIFLENTNLAYTLKKNPEIGNIRETFLLNQLLNAGLEVYAPTEGDFLVNELILEAGGKTKSSRQVSHQKKWAIAADNIETGYDRKIPLWLFGFLY